ncbi:serine/threonine-protein kinase HipA [Rhizobium mongolense subsp. loessense]|uniref:Serine/threonine-protein kinase HipA n=1 Tax=Rhizobium mongolense subsp. loessense TaxID=158890 RepID=A0A1G4QUB4_9HYPH|nr:type II toxin-antitoxin system HipA family toxin [Rhizobium mongolense]SCW48230.1 serine/threonine-protein kinase HipA [Rhizobium mongolense subsp. loessense]
MTTKVLNVWWDSRVVGQFTQDRHGDIAFMYGEAWLSDRNTPPLSASLPKRPEQFSRRECRPFFGGLLPEENQRLVAAQALGVSPGNDFALLDRLGGDVAGALQLLPEGEVPPDETMDARIQPTPLDDAGIVRILDALPNRPLLAGEEGLRLSLAGAQSKVPVVVVDGRIALPLPGQPTTHILKPPIARFKGTTENEAFVMKLAAAIGLNVAPLEARSVEGRPFLLVERYDRVRDNLGIMRRIHQEDFCQALGVPPESKYASEGGPTFKDCFELLRRVSARPAADIAKLLDAAIFNLIVGNADAHGKNYSILYDDQGPRIAPLYDLLSTVLYPDLSSKMAMRIGKGATIAEIDAEGWQVFAKDVGVGLALVRRRVAELCGAIMQESGESGIMSVGVLGGQGALEVSKIVNNRAKLVSLTVG